MRSWVTVPAFALALVAAPAAAQQPAAPAAPAANEPRVAPYEVGKAQPPATPGSTVVAMTLEQAISRALERNLDIQSARLNPTIQRYAMDLAHAAFTPTVTTQFGYNNSSQQSTSQLDGGARTTSERNTLNVSFNQPLRFYGGRLSTSFNNSRTATDNAFSTRNPSYASTLSFNYTQPLLAGLSIDNARNALRTQEIQELIVDDQLKSQIQNLTEQVRVAYWSLRATIEQLEIQRQSLAQAQQLLNENRIRVNLGRMAEIELFQAEAQVASAEQALINAQIQWQNQDLALKRLLVGGADDALLGQTINPVEPVTLPSIQAPNVDIQAAIRIALNERSDLRQTRRQREIAELNLDVTREALRPDLSLSAGYSLQGVGGNIYERTSLGGQPQLVQESGYFDGLSSIGKLDTPTWNVTLNFSYPVGHKAAEANTERAEVQLNQSELAMKSQELAIVTEVTNAGLAVGNTYAQLEASRRSREAAERNADAELRKFSVGASTNFQVVQTSNQLTSARLNELRATFNYVNAIAEFERVQRVGR
jgi:outer membrane protein